MSARWKAPELNLAIKAWRTGMCARCVSRVLSMHGYQRSYRAVQSLAKRYPEADRKGTGGYQA